MAAITIHIDDTTYEHASALFAVRGKTPEQAVKELFERAAVDEEPVYTHLPLTSDTLSAMQECEDVLSGKIPAKRYTDVHQMFEELMSEAQEEDE